MFVDPWWNYIGELLCALIRQSCLIYAGVQTQLRKDGEDSVFLISESIMGQLFSE